MRCAPTRTLGWPTLASEPAGALTKGDGKGAGPGEANEAVLAIVDLSAGYAGHAVVIEVSLSLPAGEVVCIIGPNGAGKSTLLKGVTRDAQRHSGRVWLNGQDISDVAANRLASRGLGWVPQLDDVFPTLTVRENLEMGGYLLSRAQVKARVEEATGVFPLLAPLMRSAAGRISGGARKVLALGRALMTNPAVLLPDEPSAGLSPSWRTRCSRCT